MQQRDILKRHYEILITLIVAGRLICNKKNKGKPLALLGAYSG